MWKVVFKVFFVIYHRFSFIICVDICVIVAQDIKNIMDEIIILTPAVCYNKVVYRYLKGSSIYM